MTCRKPKGTRSLHECRLVLTHPTFARADGSLDVNQREWHVRPEYEWLTRSECPLGRRLANYALPRAAQRKREGSHE